MEEGICILDTADFMIIDKRKIKELQENITSLEDIMPVKFECNMTFDDMINGGYFPIIDSYFNTKKIFEMFQEWYQFKPTKEKIHVNVHAGPIDNAFAGGNEIDLGDGKKLFHPLTSIDVIGHELAHILTFGHSNARMIHEAFGDMTGEIAELFAFGKNDWKVGAAVWKEPGGALRYLDDPPRDKKSIKDARDKCPYQGYHTIGGLFNHAFYQLSTTEGWGIRDTYRVFLLANRMYWSPKDDEAGIACGLVKAAKDAGMDHSKIENVFRSENIVPCKSQTFGISNTIELDTSGETIYSFNWNVSGNLGDVVIQTSLGGYGSSGSATLTVATENGKWVASSGNQTNYIFLPFLTPGLVGITIEGNANFTGLNLYVISHITHINEWDIVSTGNCCHTCDSYNKTNIEFQFNISQELLNIVGNDSSLIVRSRQDALDSNHQLFVRHEEPVDADSYLADAYGHQLGDGITETFLCRPATGTWYGLLQLCGEDIEEQIYELYYAIVHTPDIVNTTILDERPVIENVA